MIGIIFTILILPFTPLFLYSNLAENVFNLGRNHEVLGQSLKINAEDEFCEDSGSDIFSERNLFPIDFVHEAGYTPIRKDDYYDIKIWAGSSVAIDVDSGTILQYDNGRKRTQIASLTKIMTAILVVENVENLDEEVEITKEALRVPGTVVGCPSSDFCNSNQMYVGEKLTVGDLFKAMLLNSANDAATALGIHIASSSENFVQMMNKKAKEIGVKDTNFCTPSGLEIDGQESQCYSSAYDIARIAAYSLKYENIWDVMRLPEDRIYSTDGKYMHELKNTDKMLDTPNCLGGKTGFTPMAGKSLLMAATDPSKKHRIVAVILDDQTRWQDMKTLVNWVFENYEWR